MPYYPPPSGGGGGITPPAGDIGGTTSAPTVVSTHLTSPLPVAQGGTGSATQDFVDLTTAQTVGGIKTFISQTNFGVAGSSQGILDLNSSTPSATGEINLYGSGGGLNATWGIASGGNGCFFQLYAAAVDSNGQVLIVGGGYETNPALMHLNDGGANTIAYDSVQRLTRQASSNTNKFLTCDNAGTFVFEVSSAGLISTAGLATPLTITPVSGTGFQCSTTEDVFLYAPISATVAGTVKIEISQLGSTYTVIDAGRAVPLGGDIDVSLYVRAGWFVRFTTLTGTITYDAATYY